MVRAVVKPCPDVDDGVSCENSPVRRLSYTFFDRGNILPGNGATHYLIRIEEARQQQPPRMAWRDGEQLPFLGRELGIQFSAGESVRREGELLQVPFSKSSSPQMLRASVIEWLSGEARSLFAERVALYSPRLEVRKPEVRLSRARTQWGSCTGRGRVLLNWRLIHVPLRLVDYVVVHELSHLRELNHSPRFWALVENVYPGCRAARRELNRLEKKLPEL